MKRENAAADADAQSVRISIDTKAVIARIKQTRTYTRFANQRSPQDFCRSAAAIAGQAAAMPSTNLVPAARGLASQLESRLR